MEKGISNVTRASSRTSINIKIPLESNIPIQRYLESHSSSSKRREQFSEELDSRVPNNSTRTFITNNHNNYEKNHPSFEKNNENTDEYLDLNNSALPENEKHRSRRDQQRASVLIIERAWMMYRNKQMFNLLKHSICAAENSLSYEILRKVSPREAEFFNDKDQQIRIRFRFGGEEFPPMIFFKIFFQSGIQKVKYINGRKMIKPTTEASADALKLMGNRSFYNLMLQDTIRQQSHPVSDEVDITTLKDYMQYLSHLDESPAYLGGKENYWRKLTLDVLPRHTIFYDVVDFAYNNRLSPTLKEEMQLLTARPVTQMMMVKQLKAISKIRWQKASAQFFKSNKSAAMLTNNSQITGRQTKQAKERAMKMKQLYREHLSKEPEDVFSEDQDEDYHHYGQGEFLNDDFDEDWDQEAHKLYEWTQGLSFSDDIIHTPLVNI